MLSKAASVVVPGVLSMALAGCGLGAGPGPSTVQLRVTSDFGARTVSQTDAPKAQAGETVLSLLMRNDAVATRGGSVQSIDGVSGALRAGRQLAWFYFVNGVEAPRGPAQTDVHRGDHIWWDLHDTSAAEHVPAVVGSFPEPFVNGIEGKRLPVRIECATVASYACRTVTARLQAIDVPAATAALGSGGAPQTLRVLVGPWVDVEGEFATEAIVSGPGASGVYARFARNGRTLTLLDQDGRPVRSVIGSAGLIAATRRAEEAPVWVVTGTDASGVELAARSFESAVLENRFAVAVTSAGALAVPETGP